MGDRNGRCKSSDMKLWNEERDGRGIGGRKGEEDYCTAGELRENGMRGGNTQEKGSEARGKRVVRDCWRERERAGREKCGERQRGG